MKRLMLLAVALCAAMSSGCGNPVDRLLASSDSRAALWDKVASSSELSSQVIDRLLSADSTRAVLLDRVLASGGARQAVLSRLATDRELMDGAVHFAVQDSSMRDHLMTLFKGMEMAGGQ
jgi:hypothetical protein